MKSNQDTLDLGQTSNFSWDEPILVTWVKFMKILISGSVVWIVQHVIFVCFRRIERLKIVSAQTSVFTCDELNE